MANKNTFYPNLFGYNHEDNMPVFYLWNRRYLGCKEKLAERILSIIN